MSYATAQAIKDSKILQTYRAKNKREMKKILGRRVQALN
jgi:hypothetical protein